MTRHCEDKPAGVAWSCFLHDNTINTHSRVAGLFMLLFAQPLNQILKTTHDQIADHGNGRVIITFRHRTDPATPGRRRTPHRPPAAARLRVLPRWGHPLAVSRTPSRQAVGDRNRPQRTGQPRHQTAGLAQRRAVFSRRPKSRHQCLPISSASAATPRHAGPPSPPTTGAATPANAPNSFTYRPALPAPADRISPALNNAVRQYLDAIDV
jgi:hypothetical protein